MKTKAICVNNINYCKFPDNIKNISEFAAYLSDNFRSFIPLEIYSENGCVAPFFIDCNTETKYFNVSLIRDIYESEIEIYSKEEYDKKLKEVIAKKCVHCVNYSEDVCESDFETHKEHINLNGECYSFEKKE